MDAIGRAVQPLSVNTAHLPLDCFNFLIREAYSLEEACNILRTKREVAMKEISLSRAWDKQVTFVFIVMRLICDRMSERNKEIDADTNMVVDYCYRTLISLVEQMNIMEEKKIAEVHARLGWFYPTIYFKLIRTKLKQYRSCYTFSPVLIESSFWLSQAVML